MKAVGNSELVTSIFGYWPSFHDAEVLSINLNREGADPRGGPTLETVVHVFEMTNEVDEQGYYVLRHHTLVRLKFFDVDCLKMDGFNHQNALWELEIIDISARQLERVKFEVKFAPSYGLACDFVCSAVSVVSAEPFTPAPLRSTRLWPRPL